MNVHDHITDWQHLPSSFLAGKRARATTVEGTTIDGFLQSMTTKFSNGGGSMVQLFFGECSSRSLSVSTVVRTNYAEHTIRYSYSTR